MTRRTAGDSTLSSTSPARHVPGQVVLLCAPRYTVVPCLTTAFVSQPSVSEHRLGSQCTWGSNPGSFTRQQGQLPHLQSGHNTEIYPTERRIQ